jgi:hypothetical protein
MDDTIGLEKQDITFFEGIKTSCERLNRTMHNIALRISKQQMCSSKQ